MMSGAQLAGWLRLLANRVELAGDNVDGKPFSEGPITVQVAPASTLRSWKHRHGSVAPPDVDDPALDVIRATIRDAFATHGATLLQRLRDESATLAENAIARGVSAALDAISLRDLKNTTTSESVRSSRAVGAAVVVVRDATDLQREERSDSFIPCPADLRLNDAQIANLEMGRMIPSHFVRNVTAGFVTKYLGDPEDKRTEANWRKGLSTAVTRTWDSKHRQDFLGEDLDEKSKAEQVERNKRALERTDRELAKTGVRKPVFASRPKSEPAPEVTEPPPKDGPETVAAILRLVGGVG